MKPSGQVLLGFNLAPIRGRWAEQHLWHGWGRRLPGAPNQTRSFLPGRDEFVGGPALYGSVEFRGLGAVDLLPDDVRMSGVPGELLQVVDDEVAHGRISGFVASVPGCGRGLHHLIQIGLLHQLQVLFAEPVVVLEERGEILILVWGETGNEVLVAGLRVRTPAAASRLRRT